MSLLNLDPGFTSSSSPSASREFPTTSYANIGDLLRRPVTPAPAPLVLITGAAGVGKRAVAECLLFLIGSEKAFLVDDSITEVVLGRGLTHFLRNSPISVSEPFNGSPTPRQNSGGLYSRSEVGRVGRVASVPEPAQGGGSSNLPEGRTQHLQPPPENQCSPEEEGSGDAAAPGGRDVDEQDYEDIMTIPLPLTPAHPDIAATAYFDNIATPSNRLFDHLLRHPTNRQRIAILAAVAPDMGALAAAVARAGRPMVLVDLWCDEDGEKGVESDRAPPPPARTRSLDPKTCSNKRTERPGPGGKPRSKTCGSGPPPRNACHVRLSDAAQSRGQGQGQGQGVRSDEAPGQDLISASATPTTSDNDAASGANNSLQPPLLSPLPPGTPPLAASPLSPPLPPRSRPTSQCATARESDGEFFTVDMSRAQVLEAALRIMEHVNLVVSERDASLCSSSTNISALTTPMETPLEEKEPNWKRT